MEKKSLNSFLEIKEMMEMNRRFYSLQTLYQSIQSKANTLDEVLYSLETKWRKQDQQRKTARKTRK